MLDRSCLSVLLLAGLVVPIAGCGTSLVDAISVTPATQSVAVSQTAQFTATGTYNHGSHPSSTQNVTDESTWISSAPNVATVDSSGMATGVSAGTATITASIPGYTGVLSSSALLTVTGASGVSADIVSVAIIPSDETLSAEGQTSQLIAIGTSGTSGLQLEVTRSPQLTWGSSIPTIASVSTTGLVTGLSVGSTTITAIYTNPDNTVVSAPPATITTTSTPAPEPLLSLSIIPSSLTVLNLQGTGNFLAIGTFSTTPNVRDLTNSVTWLSSMPSVFPVSTNSDPANPGASGGVVTAYGSGNAVIIAEATDPTTGSIQTATATFNCPLVLPNPNGNPPTPGSCYPGSEAPGLLSTLTVYNEGLNTTNWLVTAPSATNTPDVIHCGPGWAGDGNTGGSVCTATYPYTIGTLGTTVLVTAPAQAGVNFGGWSYNCTPSTATGVPLPGPVFYTAAGPNYCTVVLGQPNLLYNPNDPLSSTNFPYYTSNETVGAIFN